MPPEETPPMSVAQVRAITPLRLQPTEEPEPMPVASHEEMVNAIRILAARRGKILGRCLRSG